MAPFKALCGQRCRSSISWFKSGEAKLLGLDLVIDVIEKVNIIRDRIKAAYDWQKSYVDKQKWQLEFQGDIMFLKVSQWRELCDLAKRVN